jgi:FkbM family methyltransferase
MSFLKRVAAQLPNRWQTELKRIYFAIQIRKGIFSPDEPEYKILPRLIKPGDWVIDIGANVGQYTKRFSELVGSHGRVIAFEPVPTTFSLLSANVELFPHQNVTLVNSAVSDNFGIVGMAMPTLSTGLTNYYEAHIASATKCALSVLTMSLDSLRIDNRISLVKIDVEGHESFVLSGMQKLIESSHPSLIIETKSQKIIDNLSSSGYSHQKLKNSPNIVFLPND